MERRKFATEGATAQLDTFHTDALQELQLEAASGTADNRMTPAPQQQLDTREIH
jgi:hypothetical protein